MLTQARVHGNLVDAAHAATAMVLPAPGGPVTEVSGPRAPSARSLSMRGRMTAQPGTAGIVTFDVRTGSPESPSPWNRAVPFVPGPDALISLIPISAG